ncbi:MAG TPA: hypothetical protein DD381_02030 [Lentisphaeria bacterium]|uniref:Uncharacterized protein n=1 Tax=Candidatus Nomurabacteria bacterium GW2011_GWE1_35_16 TaxID=1618761 RepID=A0A0G0BQB9_9BACT|nr:MAG: hypothetical protein UR55_C0017G0010 [Candidatus Nomurabacteria bacterium GW2011_GWF1_34_20]KKP61575.1 MAG: hypothetical protein UR57_C0016G0010 [Candidatus Nomurabacteria bacterium GW2011_GWE2_34_25]KKP65851.1 MAG: hypothetical protein UR64_C0017G0010 [Candidatus Nomurabacteria bacterium GW2011_GWE1_35_16]KKP82836.1 MAG: hypothetical protein UR85_C0012G0005 [Candidatus Nomurabacteria bacterium GW2011_GWF2_35_66]HAX65396.1 hypothetical protein [Candidatus Nomurabacteria bacterium]HBM15
MDENKTQTNNKGNLKTVRTYLSDMADTVRANEISVIKVALAEQNKQAREDLYRKVEGTPVKKIFWFIGGLVFIAGAIYGSTFLFKEKAIKETPQIIMRKGDSLISYDEISTLTLVDTENLISKINTSKKEGSKVSKIDSIKFISLVKEIDGSKELIKIEDIFLGMKSTAPSSLIRSLSNSYMIGTYTKNGTGSTGTTDSNPNLFLIFQSTDYSYTYAGMLEWEKTMAGDMFDLFEFNTNDNKIEINKRKWRDIIISNKDARVLFNENNKPIIYYIFIDKENLVITDSVDAIKEIISKLIIKNIKPL